MAKRKQASKPKIETREVSGYRIESSPNLELIPPRH